ncbi:putative major facilitator superfamily transporter [Teratosphaeria nubilosa]|uniref:Putative major facilitator superfamily transporter n=1 Tax=Teratosphaeria nubilosa TaxID=161662 RepID=A0A6G1LIU9_9PEZI|nr:putative major facilitator superfamily transporter [Teratosphaeria nubilosa]
MSHEPQRLRNGDSRVAAADTPAANETTSLLRDGPAEQASGVWGTLSVLLLGVFISQVDTTLVLATYSKIASDFQDLDSASWLISAYILAQCAVQPLYGKLSDIFGRKGLLQTSYVLFTIGTACAGISKSIGGVIASRALQGAGAAGMVSMVSIVITDLVPLHEVAQLRSYVNICQTTGRSCGGVIGGLLSQAVGWRWAFLIQVPPVLAAILLVQWRLNITPKQSDSNQSHWGKLKRVDFVGSFFLATTILASCFVLDAGGQKMPWDSWVISGCAVVAIASAICFTISARYVPEPIFPLRLLTHYSVFTNCLIVFLQATIQLGLTTPAPLFLQATRKASFAEAGAYLIPAFAGNTIGGLLAGYWIKRTGLFKALTVLAPILSILCMVLCLYTWNESTSALASMAIFPGGFAMGVISASAFVGVASGVNEADIAIAASGMYLSFNLGGIAGVSASGAVYETSLRAYLQQALDGWKNKDEILQKALSDITYVQSAGPKLRKVFVAAHVYGFHNFNYFGLMCGVLSLLVALVIRGQRLKTRH